MIEDFLQIFSYWPRSLAESFGDLLGLALPQSDLYARAKSYYEKFVISPVTAESDSYLWMQGYPVLQINFLSPSNPQFKRVLSEQKPYQHIPIDMAQRNILGEWIPFMDSIISNDALLCVPTVQTAYDSRLFSSVQNNYSYVFTPVGDQWMSQGDFGISLSVSWGKTKAVISATANIKNFSGAASVLILHENGKTFPGVSMPKLYEFSTYLQAYEKNLSQISATVNNSEAAARDELTRYSRELQAQIDVEARNLENLEINLKNQAQAEAFAVSRDIANLIVSAQGVALQISERLP